MNPCHRVVSSLILLTALLHATLMMIHQIRNKKKSFPIGTSSSSPPGVNGRPIQSQAHGRT